MKPVIKNGSLCIAQDDGSIYAKDITAYLSYPGNDYNVLTAPVIGEWTLDGNTARAENAEMDFILHGDGILVRTRFTNVTGGRIEDPGDFFSFSCTLADLPEKMLCCNIHNENGNRVSEMRSQIDTVRTVWGSRYVSADMTAYDSVGGGHGLFGYATFERYFGAVQMGADGRAEACQFLEAHPLESGETVESDLVYISRCGDVAKEGLPKYARIVTELSGVGENTGINRFDVPVGFCTWYYYGSRISSDIMRENMDEIERRRGEVPVRYIQVDDGWFDCFGNWDPKDNFGGDMKSFADEVKSRGFIPGIWTAPFGADPGSRIFTEHPEYFVKTKSGNPWMRPAFDFSHPGACDYIRWVFRRFSHEWGYRYIKMDIITGTLAPGVYHDPNFTAVKNLRRGFEIMRESVTDDTFLLACTCPISAAAGLVDGMRVSCDMMERWDSLRDVFNSVLKRYYMHKAWFINDADCLLVRTAGEEDEQCWRLCTRTESEIRTYVTAMAASGGALMLSDKMPLLKPEQIRMISYLFPLNKDAAVPLDLMESYIPGILDFGVRHGTRTVALINWGDAEMELVVPDSDGKLVFEFWSGEFRGLSFGDIRECVEPHGCRVFFLTDPEPDGQTVVGTDSSVVMDIRTSFENGKKAFVKNKTDEHLYLAELCGGEYRISVI